MNVDWTVGPGRLTSTTAWRYWNWNPSNDRDFIGLPVTTISAAPSKQQQWTQEVRYAGDVSPRVNVVVGVFAFQPGARLRSVVQAGAGLGGGALPAGADARRRRRRACSTATASTSTSTFRNVSAAVFGQLEWSVTDRLRLLPGLRFNYDQKDVDFDQQVYGGLQTTDPALIALQRSVLAPQAYTADVDDTNLSGQLTVAYKVSPSRQYLRDLRDRLQVGRSQPERRADRRAGQPVLSAATVKPEDVRHVEFGMKTEPVRGVTANFTVFNTEIKDFQAQVVNAQVGVLRGYLANAEKVRVRGAEFDGNARINKQALVLRRGRLHGRQIRLVPRRAAAARGNGRAAGEGHLGLRAAGHLQVGAHVRRRIQQSGEVFGQAGELFGAVDTSYRSEFSSSATASRYLVG